MKIFLLLGMHTKQVILLFLTIFLINSCDTNEPPLNSSIKLTLEDVSCTEAWIELTTNDLQLPTTITLKQFNPAGDTVTQNIILSNADSLLYVDSLLPKQSYIFQSSIQSINQSEVKSNELSVTTMDTTSHDFTFETFTFGGNAGSCILYDVAIIDENNIWAVGEINIADTSINGYTTYNAVHWDGNEWELKRLKTNACGGVEYPPIQAIFAFSADDILFAHIDGSITHYNGIEFINDCSLITQLNGSANKIWGISKNNFYVVSGNGFIAHFNGQNWQRIESGTELDFHDIYGSTDLKTGEQQILAVCSRNLPLDKGIYKIEGNTAVEISSTPIQWELFALWFVPSHHYYVIGSGIYEKNFLSDSSWENGPLDITHYGTSGIRGNGVNDVFVAGAFGEFLHFNGVTWKSYINVTGWFSGSYGGVAVKNNLIITVGYDGAQAKIMMGYRN